jgi:hypothetical protein
MLIRITGRAEVTLDSGEAVTEPALVRELDGAESDLACGDYLDASLADLGVAGGTVRLVHDADEGGFRVVTEYTALAPLTPEELERLEDETAAQWSDGIGEGCFDELAFRLGITVNLCPDDPGRGVRAEQVDDGREVRPPQTALAKVAREGDLASLRGHLDAGADPEARIQGYTPLHLAILYGHAEAALELIARGSDVSALDPQGQDALMLTATSNKLGDADAARVARVLLERGASVHGLQGADPARGDYTPLFVAENRRKTGLAAVLREFGATRRGRPLRRLNLAG